MQQYKLSDVLSGNVALAHKIDRAIASVFCVRFSQKVEEVMQLEQMRHLLEAKTTDKTRIALGDADESSRLTVEIVDNHIYF